MDEEVIKRIMQKQLVVVYYEIDDTGSDFFEIKGFMPTYIGEMTITEKKYFDKYHCMSDGGGTELERINFRRIEGALDTDDYENLGTGIWAVYVNEQTMIKYMLSQGFLMVKDASFIAFINHQII